MKLSPYAFIQELDNNGKPLSAGKIYTYEAGTSTPKTTYSDYEGVTPNANPIVLDAAGRANIWLDSGSYKFVLKDSSGNTIDTRDDITGDSPNAFGASITSISGNLTITETHRNGVVIATASATLSLPSAASVSSGFYFLVKNTSASGTVTIDPNLSETIDGSSTITIKSGQSAIIITNGTLWYSIFKDADSIFLTNAQASTSSGVIVKNSSGTTVATFGATAGTTTVLAGSITASGAASVSQSATISGTSSSPAYIEMFEDTDNGTNKITIIAPSSIASDRTITIPDATGTLALTSDLNVRFVSAEQTVVAASGGSAAHSLGSVPIELYAYLVCKTTELGFAVGDRLMIPGDTRDAAPGTAQSRGVQVWADSTSVKWRIGADGILLNNATTGTGGAFITAANWRLVIVAKT